MIVFAKRLVELFVRGASSQPMPMFWTF